jgi:hypothetical protein
MAVHWIRSAVRHLHKRFPLRDLGRAHLEYLGSTARGCVGDDLSIAASVVSGHEEVVGQEKLLWRALGVPAGNHAEVQEKDCVERLDKDPRS